MSDKKHPYHEFRVIAGELKGRLIKAPDLGVTRPPLTRLRKSIFDFLSPYIVNATYLDLFSGTGSYLFDAVSRGAASATGVELEPVLVESVNKQAQKYGVDDRLVCLCDDVFEAVGSLHARNNRYDIIMIAPPQYKGIIDKTLSMIRQYDLRNDDTLILCQHDSSETKKLEFADYEIWQQRKYGNTTFTILK